MIKISTKFFLDQPEITDRVDKMNRRGLTSAGSLLRRGVRQSIRRTKMKASYPDDPPKTHGHGKYSLKDAYYNVDIDKLSVITGYEKSHLCEIQNLHEYGGSQTLKRPAFRKGTRVLIPTYKMKGNFVIVHNSATAKPRIIKSKYDAIAARIFYKRRLENKRFAYSPRPSLNPAIEKNAEQAVELWKDAL